MEIKEKLRQSEAGLQGEIETQRAVGFPQMDGVAGPGIAEILEY